MYKAWVAVASLILVSGSILAAEAPAGKTLSAAEIKKIFVGKVATDGAHWSYHLKPDGSVDGTELGSIHKGRWAIRGKQLCLTVPVGTKEDCVEVVRGGSGFIFRANGLDVSDVTIEPYRSRP